MGTETYWVRFASTQIYDLPVELNNPQMGTETFHHIPRI